MTDYCVMVFPWICSNLNKTSTQRIYHLSGKYLLQYDIGITGTVANPVKLSQKSKKNTANRFHSGSLMGESPGTLDAVDIIVTVFGLVQKKSRKGRSRWDLNFQTLDEKSWLSDYPNHYLWMPCIEQAQSSIISLFIDQTIGDTLCHQWLSVTKSVMDGGIKKNIQEWPLNLY